MIAAIGLPRFSFAAFLTTSVLLLTQAAFAADKVVLQLRWDHQFQFAGYYAALWQGYYADAGIEVEIRSAVTSNRKILRATEEVAEGRADFGIGAADILVARDKGAALIVAATIFQKSGVALMAKESSGLSSPADLKRLRVYRAPGSPTDVEFQAMLRAVGVDPKNIEPHLAGTGSGMRRLLEGKIDAFVGVALATPWVAKQHGVSLTILRPESYGVDFYGDSLFTSEQIARENPDLVKRVVSASLKGWRYALDHPEEMADRISREMQRTMPVKDVHGLNRFLIDEVRKLTLFPVVELGHTRAGRWHAMHERLRDAGVVTAVFDYDAFVFDPVKNAQLRRQVWFVALLTVAGVCIFAIAGILVWIKLLRRTVESRTTALRASEERFRDVTESISDWFWEMGPDLRYTYVSPQAYQRTGFPSDRFLGKTREELGPPAGNLDGWRRHLDDLKAHRPFRDYSHERILSNGQSMHILLSGKPLQGAEGEFLGYRGTARDITAKVEAERQAIRSEERFQYAIENSNESFALYNADEKLVIFNTRFLENSMLGAPFLSIGMSFEDVVTAIAEQGFVAGVDEHNEKEWIEERLSGFRARTAVPEYQMSNGRWRQARYDGLPDGSTIARYLDITDQKRQRDALRESEERFALAAAGTNDGIWDFDFQSSEVYRSARLLEILGYDEREFRPNLDEFLDYLHPDDRDGRVKAFTAHIEERTPYDHEFRLRHKSGEYIWVRASGQAVWDEDGKPLRMAGSISDISERKRAEEALRESEERFSNVFNNSPTAIMLKDLDGRFRLVNKQFAAQLGMSPDEVVGKTSHDLWPVEQAAALVDQDRAVLEMNTKIVHEHIISLVDGHSHPIVVTKFPVADRNGQPIGVGAIAIDVTEQRRAEALLNQARKMEVVGQLTGGIAHEFNNLLMVVVGNIEMLKDQLPKDGHLERFASTAMKGAMRGAELTQRLLTFSRKQTLAVVSVDLNDLILGLRDMLRRTLGETITLEMEFAENLPKTLADIGQIEGALLNFVLNSRDAMPKGGTIIVRTSNTTLDAEAAAKADADPGDYVSLEIADTGHGMTAETIEQSFEPFFTTKDVGEGTGLGLSVVYGFAKQSGGFVEIDSEVGRGTTIRLSLPCAVEEERDTGEKNQIPAEPVKRRAAILVVEDDPDVRALVVGLLIGFGYNVVEAEDGQTALARLEEHPDIDLLFTDVVLPHGMSGQNVAREAKRRRPDLKVVFTSGYPDREYGNLSLDGEDPMIVAKPYRKSELAEKLAAVLNM